MILDKIIKYTVPRRSIGKLKEQLPSTRCGDVIEISVVKLSSLGIKAFGSAECMCERCNTQYNLSQNSLLHYGKTKFDITKFCSECRSEFGKDAMCKTIQTENFKKVKREKALIYNNRPETKEKRRVGWRKFFNENHELIKERAVKNLKHYYGEEHWNFNPNKSKYKKYCGEVASSERKYFPKEIKEMKHGFIFGNTGNVSQLDHKFSKKNGFINNIHPIIIANPHNLEVIPRTLNRSKWHKNSIELGTLLSLIELDSYKTLTKEQFCSLYK